MTDLAYRGSIKHKDRPGRGRKGTLCPEWSYKARREGFAGDPVAHRWDATAAHAMLSGSEIDPRGSGKRWATSEGIAFVAQGTNDGTWHGYPEPWHKAPPELVEKWLAAGVVTPQQLRRYNDFPRNDVRWALESDVE